MRIIKLSKNTTSPATKTEADFTRFVKELEAISNRFGIALGSIGTVQTFDPTRSQVIYIGDLSSRNLEPRIHRLERTTSFQVEVTEMLGQGNDASAANGTTAN